MSTTTASVAAGDAPEKKSPHLQKGLGIYAEDFTAVGARRRVTIVAANGTKFRTWAFRVNGQTYYSMRDVRQVTDINMRNKHVRPGELIAANSRLYLTTIDNALAVGQRLIDVPQSPVNPERIDRVRLLEVADPFEPSFFGFAIKDPTAGFDPDWFEVPQEPARESETGMQGEFDWDDHAQEAPGPDPDLVPLSDYADEPFLRKLEHDERPPAQAQHPLDLVRLIHQASLVVGAWKSPEQYQSLLTERDEIRQASEAAEQSSRSLVLSLGAEVDSLAEENVNLKEYILQMAVKGASAGASVAQPTAEITSEAKPQTAVLHDIESHTQPAPDPEMLLTVDGRLQIAYEHARRACRGDHREIRGMWKSAYAQLEEISRGFEEPFIEASANHDKDKDESTIGYIKRTHSAEVRETLTRIFTSIATVKDKSNASRLAAIAAAKQKGFQA